MALDECTPGDADYTYARKSLSLTQRWLERGWKHMNETEGKYGYKQAFFPIVQGCVYPELRREAARHVAELGADGNAIGGLAVGEPTEKMYEMIEVVNEILPMDKPRYLMGVGTPANILEAIERGVDMFDCVMPTRLARHGVALTPDGPMHIKNQRWATDSRPIDPEGHPHVTQFSRAYVRHLFKAGEILALRLLSFQNLEFYLRLMAQAREAIAAGTFGSFKDSFIARYKANDIL